MRLTAETPTDWGYEQEHVCLRDIHQPRYIGKLPQGIVLRNLPTQALCAVLVKCQASNFRRESSSIAEHDGEVGRERVVIPAGDARESLEVAHRVGNLRTGRCERHLEGRHDIHSAVVRAEAVQQPLDALGEIHGWRLPQPVVKSSSRVGGVEA